MTHVRAAVHRWLAGAGAVAAATALAVVAAPAASAEGEILGTGNPNAIKDSYIVVFDDGAAANGVQALTESLATRYGATVEHTYQHAVRGFAGTMSEQDARKLAADPAVDYVEQNGTVHLAATQPNPPSWGLDRIDQRNLPLNASYTYPNNGAGVRAYILDTGIRTTHVDFGGRASWGTNTTGDGNNSDCHGHGTHVAGTVGGNAYGVAKGVALTAVKVLNCAGSGSWAGVTAGVDWVTGHHTSGPAVANMSLGGTGSNATLENAIRASIADGVVYAIASGNSYGADACNYTPARTPEAITVNASQNNDARAGFSNVGPCTDIFAPGVNIVSAHHTSDTASTSMSGTSMATPHVAGAAAIILAANPGLNPQQVASTMYAAATPNKITDPGAGSPNRLLFVGGNPPPTHPDHLVRGQGLQPGQFLRSQNGAYTLIMQGDGNLVLYNSAGQPLWHTATHGRPGAYAIFQTDGNFVVYQGTTPLFHTGTHGTAASVFVVQNDSNIVMYGPQGQVFWHRWQ